MKLGWALLYIGAAMAQTRNPAAWGGDHVGKPLPEHVHGDECLFCHRNDIGQTWQKNTHGVSLRSREDAEDLVKKLNPPKEVEFFLGSRHEIRFLKKNGYGKFAILNKGAWDKDCSQTAARAATRLRWRRRRRRSPLSGTTAMPATASSTSITAVTPR